MQPGQTITPGQQPEQAAPPSEQTPTPPVTEQIATEAPTPQPAQPEPFVPAPEQQVFTEPAHEEIPQPYELPPEAPAPSSTGEVVHWTASEYIDHAKGPAWFAIMGLGLFAVVVLTYFVLKDVLAAVLVGIAGVTFGIFAGRRPQVLEYSITPQGILIGSRAHAFSDFKSFSLTENGPLPAILLLPLKRFLPPITIFYDPKEEGRIVEALADYLPHEDREPDVVDRLMSRIRF